MQLQGNILKNLKSFGERQGEGATVRRCDSYRHTATPPYRHTVIPSYRHTVIPPHRLNYIYPADLSQTGYKDHHRIS